MTKMEATSSPKGSKIETWRGLGGLDATCGSSAPLRAALRRILLRTGQLLVASWASWRHLDATWLPKWSQDGANIGLKSIPKSIEF